MSRLLLTLSKPLFSLSVFSPFLLLLLFMRRPMPGDKVSTLPPIPSFPSIAAAAASAPASPVPPLPSVSPLPPPLPALPDAPATSSDRVAVCVTGAVRTLYYSAVHANIRSSFITPLRAAFPNTDVFFIARMEDDPRPLEIATKRNDSGSRAVMEQFAPVEIIEYTGIDEYAAEIGFDTARFVEQKGSDHASVRGPRSCFQTPNENGGKLHFSHSLFRTHQCLSVIQRREASLNITYDWVYRIRPDIVFYQPLPLPSSLKRNVFYTAAWTEKFISGCDVHWRRTHNLHPDAVIGNGPIGDQFFVAGRAVAERAFRAFDVINLCDPYGMPDRNSESSLRWWILLSNMRYETMDIVWDIVRDYANTHCPLMEYIETKNKTWDERKEMCNKFRSDNLNGLP